MARPTDAQLEEARRIAEHVASRYLDRASGLRDDVAQSVLVKFFTTDVDTLENWRAWVNRVARNEAIDHARRQHDARVAAGELDSSPSASSKFSPSAPPKRLREVGPSAAGMWSQVLDALTRTLSEREREVLLASLDGANNADIAEDFGYASANSVAVTLTRIRGKLRDAYPDRGEVLELLGEQRLY